MANNLAVTELSSIFMNQSEALGSDNLNKKFGALLQNDRIINNLFSNAIGTWQCLWYYDSNMKGYSIGDAVWLNAEEPLEFLKTHYGLIKQYTDLNPQILNKLPDFDDKNAAVISAYQCAMSGYTDSNLGKDIVLPPIFDIGDFSKPIQLAVSLKNNNKDLLSDSKSWKKVFVNEDKDEANIRKLLSTFYDRSLNEHLVNYHLSGHEEQVQAKLSNYLDVPEETYDYVSFPDAWQKQYSENAVKEYGLDRATFFIRKPYSISGTVSQYQAVRYWKSGLIEHFGTIDTRNVLFRSEDGKKLLIPFDWKFLNFGGTQAYRKDFLSERLYGILTANETEENSVPPIDNRINVTYKQSHVEVESLDHAIPFKNNEYNVSISPVWQTVGGISEDYIGQNYGTEELVQQWNSNYLTNEILSRNTNYLEIRLGTRVISPYLSYYAIGKGNF